MMALKFLMKAAGPTTLLYYNLILKSFLLNKSHLDKQIKAIAA